MWDRVYKYDETTNMLLRSMENNARGFFDDHSFEDDSSVVQLVMCFHKQ